MPTGHNARLTRRELLSRLGRLQQVAVVRLVVLDAGAERGVSWGTGREPDSTRERGELAFLELGGARRYDLEIGVLYGVGAIEQFAAPVDAVSRRSALQVGGGGNG